MKGKPKRPAVRNARNITMSQDAWDALTALADEVGQNRSNVIEQLVRARVGLPTTSADGVDAKRRR